VSGERRNLKNDLHLEQGLSVFAAGLYRHRRARPVRHGAFNHFGERAARIYAGVTCASELKALGVKLSPSRTSK
jgi:hypothetical protein